MGILWGNNPKKDIKEMRETIMAAKGEELSVLEFMETATAEKDKFIAAIPHKTPAELSAYAGYLMEIIEFQQKDIKGIIKETSYLERRARSRALSGSSTDKKAISLFQDLMNKVRELEKTLEQQYDALAINHHKVFIGHREEEKNISIAFSQIVHGLEAVIPELERVELTEKNHRSLGYAMSSLLTGIVVGSFLTVGIPTSAWAATGSSPTDTVNKGLGALELYLGKLSEIGGRLPPGTTAVALGGLGALMAILVIWRKNNSKKMERKALEVQQKKLGEERAKDKTFDEAIAKDLKLIKEEFPNYISGVTIDKGVATGSLYGDDEAIVNKYVSEENSSGAKVSRAKSGYVLGSYFEVRKWTEFTTKEQFKVPGDMRMRSDFDMSIRSDKVETRDVRQKHFGEGTLWVNIVPIIKEDGTSGDKKYYWIVFGKFREGGYSGVGFESGIEEANTAEKAVSTAREILDSLARRIPTKK